MTSLVAMIFAGGTVAAFADWISVASDDDRNEEIAKPLVLVALILAAAFLVPDSSPQRWWFVAALVFSLIGDVALLPRFDAFIVGLGAFLVAHIGFVVGLSYAAGSWGLAAVGAAIALGAMATVGRRVIMGAPDELRMPVTGYMLALGAMVVVAFATSNWLFILGAISFFVSDSLLGWGRFVGEAPAGRIAVHITYHLAQALLILGLVG